MCAGVVFSLSLFPPSSPHSLSLLIPPPSFLSPPSICMLFFTLLLLFFFPLVVIAGNGRWKMIKKKILLTAGWL